MYSLISSKKEANKKLLNKSLYYLLGVSAIILTTPFISNLVTASVTNFEGARGYAYIYLLPFIAIFLFIIWFLLDYFLIQKKKFYKILTYFFALVTLTLTTTYFIENQNHKKQRQQAYRNSYNCSKQFKDGFKGIIIDTSSGKLKIRKMDSTYSEFKYDFRNRKETIKKHFFIG